MEENNKSDGLNKLSSILVGPAATITSITQPLLSERFNITTAYHPPHGGGATTWQLENQEDEAEIVQISYNYGPRPFKDLVFLALYILFVLSTYGFGIFASVNSNPYHGQASAFSFNPATSTCTLQNSTFFANPTSLNPSKSYFFKSLVWTLDDFTFSANPTSLISSKSSLLESLIWTLVITLLLSVPFVSFVLHLLKNYTMQVVYLSLPFFVLVPVFFNVYWFVACTVSSTCSDAFPLAYRILVLVFVFMIIGVIVWIFVVNWHRIHLTVRIIGVASNALSRNLGLLGVLPALPLSLFVYYAPVVIFLVFAKFNGEIVPRENDGHYLCVWKLHSWVPAYYGLAILTMLWSAAVMVEVQVYIISDTISQWYFSMGDDAPKRGIRRSLRNAFGSSSGTICFSGLLIFAVRVVRAMVDSAREEDASGIVNLILRCCVNSLLAAVDFLNKFTINFAAITGEAYCSSARMTYELLKRNLLSAVSVETVSTRLLAGIIFVLSAIYAIVVFSILRAVSHLGVEAYFVAVMAWLVLMVVLGFFVHVLDNVIDTVYVCYAIDRDRGDISKRKVHDVYVHLPISRSHRAVKTALVV